LGRHFSPRLQPSGEKLASRPIILAPRGRDDERSPHTDAHGGAAGLGSPVAGSGWGLPSQQQGNRELAGQGHGGGSSPRWPIIDEGSKVVVCSGGPLSAVV
jgi:hypothetical protein